MTTQSQPSGFVIFLKGLFKLLLAILLGLIIGAALYMAGSYVYQQAVLPTQDNARVVANMQTQYAEENKLLKEKNQQLENRISQLELNQTEQANQLDELQTLLTQSQSDYEAVLKNKEAFLNEFDRLDKNIKTLTEEQNQLAKDFEDLTEQNEQVDEDPQEMLKPLQLELKLLKSMQQINRSRLFILQANYGIAKQEIELAMQFVSEMIPFATPDQQDNILLWQTRLELIGSYLPDQPALANEDLEILWQRMAEGFNETENKSDSTSVMDAESTEAPATHNPTPTAQPTQTPTPTATP
ncbi:MAG: hypothetical protein CL609_24540 [Anaerolineaceae bacterium]|nr:hypothetical protein [Anaerolineaceae bacterium]